MCLHHIATTSRPRHETSRDSQNLIIVRFHLCTETCAVFQFNSQDVAVRTFSEDSSRNHILHCYGSLSKWFRIRIGRVNANMFQFLVKWFWAARWAPRLVAEYGNFGYLSKSPLPLGSRANIDKQWPSISRYSHPTLTSHNTFRHKFLLQPLSQKSI